jgi:hypothetical protein
MEHTSLLDIPFECLPINTISQLSTLNRATEERALKEFLTRDVGWEVYQYLKILPQEMRSYKIMHEMDTKILWDIIHAIQIRTYPYSDFLFLPFNNSTIRVDICAIRYHEHMAYMIHHHSAMHVAKIVPSIVSGTDAISHTMEQAIEKITGRIHECVYNMVIPYSANDFMNMEWHTNPMTFYIIMSSTQSVYISPSFPLSYIDTIRTTELAHLNHDPIHIRKIVNILVDAGL